MSETAWMSQLAGRFIVFDGPDGSGKSTQFSRFAEAAAGAGVELETVREPGGTEIGERIRAILLDPAHESMDLRAEMLLYMAARAQLVAERIRPALHHKKLVLADRYVSSTLAYQGHAGGLGREAIEATAAIATGGLRADLTVVFDVDGQTARQRIGPEKDRIESRDEAYHALVRAGYLAQAEQDPDRVAVVDSTEPVDLVFRKLCELVRRKLTAV